MSSSTAKYQPLSTIPDNEYTDNDIDLERGGEEELEGEISQTAPLLHPTPRRTTNTATTSKTLKLFGLLSGTSTSNNSGGQRWPRSTPSSLSLTPLPITPASSDGVFANIPAKPTSSKDVDQDDEEMGADEWIFMTPEQRSKLPPPKYSKIKRDRAPRYTVDYTPPEFLPSTGNNSRPKRYRPRINALSAGSSTLFVASAVIATLLPIIGFAVLYFSNGGKWKSHAARLGSRTGLGLSLFHIGAMVFYIPALLVFPSPYYYIPLIACLFWTICIGVPFGWRIARRSSKEYAWIKAQERILVDRFRKANLAVEDGRFEEVDDDDNNNDNGYTYIEGTDMRVRDLKIILSRARDARLARSLRAAGF